MILTNNQLICLAAAFSESGCGSLTLSGNAALDNVTASVSNFGKITMFDSSQINGVTINTDIVSVDGQGSLLTMRNTAILSPNSANCSFKLSNGAVVSLSGTTNFAMSGTAGTPAAITFTGGTITFASQAINVANLTISVPGGAVLANFTDSIASLTVTFTDKSFADGSKGSVSAWSWSFGDGGTATVQNPSHTYAAHGTYTVTLTATTSGGATSTATTKVTV